MMPVTGSSIPKILTACLALLIALAGPAGAAARSAAEGDPATVVSALRVQTPGYQLDARGLRVPGYGTTSIPGAPALPVWSTAVELPAAGEPVVTVAGGAPEMLDLDAPLPAAPVPRPPARSRSAGRPARIRRQK